MSIVKWNGRNLLKSIAENEKEATKLYRMFASEARIGEKFLNCWQRMKKDTKKSTMHCLKNIQINWNWKWKNPMRNTWIY